MGQGLSQTFFDGNLIIKNFTKHRITVELLRKKNDSDINPQKNIALSVKDRSQYQSEIMIDQFDYINTNIKVVLDPACIFPTQRIIVLPHCSLFFNDIYNYTLYVTNVDDNTQRKHFTYSFEEYPSHIVNITNDFFYF